MRNVLIVIINFNLSVTTFKCQYLYHLGFILVHILLIIDNCPRTCMKCQRYILKHFIVRQFYSRAYISYRNTTSQPWLHHFMQTS